ncbi:MAG: AgmX/PglI C-terminal domain-containing protein [Fibrobacter sp.]|nr:AgmX/PglI C-terminal domain-containing protein [Fibrobacter sp.]
MQNIQSLRYVYNQRLRDKPELRGKVVCRFAIDEFGNVLMCDIVESTVLDNVLEAKIKGMISRWRFEKIDKVGDVTEIVYPFVFSS